MTLRHCPAIEPTVETGPHGCDNRYRAINLERALHCSQAVTWAK